MRRFSQYEVREAIEHSENGGQALHCHRLLAGPAPRCFVRDVNTGKDIGHLFDQDKNRLVKTAKSLGVKVIKIDREGTTRQHIDLCGKPMENALGQCALRFNKVPIQTSLDIGAAG